MKSFTEDPNQTRSKSLKALGILTAAYFVIEIIINHAVFRQMSYSGSFFSIMSMEFWGKIITGFGLALIISRFMTTSDAFKRFMQEKTKFKYKPWAASTYKLFALVCVFTIPLSFFLQNKLIDYIVESSTPEDRNKAILVMAAHGTITPFFKPIVKVDFLPSLNRGDSYS